MTFIAQQNWWLIAEVVIAFWMLIVRILEARRTKMKRTYDGFHGFESYDFPEIKTVDEMVEYLHPFDHQPPASLDEYLKSVGLAKNQPVWVSLIDDKDVELPGIVRVRANPVIVDTTSVKWERVSVQVPDNVSDGLCVHAAVSGEPDGALTKFSDRGLYVSVGTQVRLSPSASWTIT